MYIIGWEDGKPLVPISLGLVFLFSHSLARLVLNPVFDNSRPKRINNKYTHTVHVQYYYYYQCVHACICSYTVYMYM